jgi:hypothetical protein
MSSKSRRWFRGANGAFIQEVTDERMGSSNHNRKQPVLVGSTNRLHGKQLGDHDVVRIQRDSDKP